jgi:hypothetical protein
VALKREQHRLSALLAERERLHRRVQKLENDLLLCEVKVDALRATAPGRLQTAPVDSRLDQFYGAGRIRDAEVLQEPSSTEPNNSRTATCSPGLGSRANDA